MVQRLCLHAWPNWSPTHKRSLENVEADYTSPEIDIFLSQHRINQINCDSNLNKRIPELTQPRRSTRVMARKIQESASPNRVQSANSRMLSSKHHKNKNVINLDENNELGSMVMPELAILSKYTNILEFRSGDDPNKWSGDTALLQHLSIADVVSGDIDSSKKIHDSEDQVWNTQNVIIVRQNTTNSYMDLYEDNQEMNKQDTETEEVEEDSFHSADYLFDNSNKVILRCHLHTCPGMRLIRILRSTLIRFAKRDTKCKTRGTGACKSLYLNAFSFLQHFLKSYYINPKFKISTIWPWMI